MSQSPFLAPKGRLKSITEGEELSDEQVDERADLISQAKGTFPNSSSEANDDQSSQLHEDDQSSQLHEDDQSSQLHEDDQQVH